MLPRLTYTGTKLETADTAKENLTRPGISPTRMQSNPHQCRKDRNTAKTAIYVVSVSNLRVPKAVRTIGEFDWNKGSSFKLAQSRSSFEELANKIISDAERKEFVEHDPLIVPAD